MTAAVYPLLEVVPHLFPASWSLKLVVHQSLIFGIEGNLNPFRHAPVRIHSNATYPFVHANPSQM